MGSSFNIRDRKYTICSRINCTTKSVVYAAFCVCCPCFYIGKTDRKFSDRIYQHLYAIKNKKMDNALSKHILNNTGHSFQFMGIEHVTVGVRGGPQPLVLEMRELEWQIGLDAFSYPGLNECCNISSILRYKSYMR